MQLLIERLRKSNRSKKTMQLFVYFFFALYCFFIPSFSTNKKIYLAGYPIFILFAIAVIVYIFLYFKFKLDIRTIWFFSFATFGLIGTIVYSRQFRSWATLLMMSIAFFVTFYMLIYDGHAVLLRIFYFSLIICWIFILFYFSIPFYYKDIIILII